jgi:phosphatidylglycerophosphate synthase
VDSNSLTFLRILMVPLLVVVLLTRFSGASSGGSDLPARGLTDIADGVIARHTKAVTVTRTLLDPIADKLLMSAAFIPGEARHRRWMVIGS